MYLIHLHLHSSEYGDLPEQAGEWLRAVALPEEGVEHVTVHGRALPDPVLGVFVIADRLELAEQRAAAVCQRALAVREELHGWELIEGRAPLIAPFYESLLDGSVHPGRNRPGPFPSSGRPFHPL